MTRRSPHAALPSVDRLLHSPDVAALVERRGRAAVVAATRAALAEARALIATDPAVAEGASLARRITAALEGHERPTLVPLLNLTGTILHTNLGRAPLPEEAIAAMAAAARGPVTLEYDLASGHRGDRDVHLADLLRELTGAEAVTVVNNNAAALMLALNTLALRKEVPVSRGELIEIGGSFRLPDIMARAGCRLREVGTTNRTHAKDFAAALGPRTGALLKVHTSNYAVRGFTAAVAERTLAGLARRQGVPLLVDLGSGTLVDLARFGLPPEPTVAATLAAGADLVCFSGDKLLGGPQAGILVGRRDLIERTRANPMRRAMRLDKVTIAGLAAVLRLYRNPDTLPDRLPALRLLARPVAAIRAMALRIRPLLAARLGDVAAVSVIDCASEVGSGALPLASIASAGLAMRPVARGGATRLAAAFRALPLPVIGRVHDGSLVLDLRTLEDEGAFITQLAHLAPS